MGGNLAYGWKKSLHTIAHEVFFAVGTLVLCQKEPFNGNGHLQGIMHTQTPHIPPITKCAGHTPRAMAAGPIVLQFMATCALQRWAIERYVCVCVWDTFNFFPKNPHMNPLSTCR